MKKIALIFCLTFGLSILTFAQKGNLSVSPKSFLKNLPNQPKIDFRNHHFFGKLDTLRSDSIEVDFPKEFLLNRELYAIPIPSQNLKLPFYALPDPQSRMPILKFDDSVNYTILKKEYK